MGTTSGPFLGLIKSHIFQLFAKMNWILLDFGNRINADIEGLAQRRGTTWQVGWKLQSKAVCPERVLFDRNITGNLRHFQGAEVEDRELTYIWCFLFSLLLEFKCRENPPREWVMSLASKMGRGAFLILPSTSTAVNCTVGAGPRNQVQISGLVYCNV